MKSMRWTLAGWALVAHLVFSSCTAEDPNLDNVPIARFFKSPPKQVTVEAFPVEVREVPIIITASGKTEVADRYEAKMPAAGIKVQKIFVEEGARVESGAPLVKFDDEIVRLRLAKARAEVQEAEAAIAHDNFLSTNREQLIADGKMSVVEANGLDESLRLHQATLDRAKVEIDLHEAETDLDQLNSPIAGIVTQRNLSNGGEGVEGQLILEVVRLDPIRFVFTIPVDAAPALENGPGISIRFAALPGQELTGEVFTVGVEAKAEGGGGVPVKLNVPNPDLVLKADMKGDVVIRTQAKKKVFPIVDTALLKTEKSHYVFKIEGNKLKKTAVEIGEPYNNQPTVTKGLVEGEVIAAVVDDNLVSLQDGAVVEVRNTRAEK